MRPSVLVVIPTKFTKYAADVTDERLYTRPELVAMVRDAGLTVTDSFVYGEVPTGLARNSGWRCRALYRGIQYGFSYAMGIGCLGRRP